MSNILYIFAEISGGGRGSMRPAEAHCWLEGGIPGEHAKTIVKEMFTKYRVPYMSLSPISRYCEDHGYIEKNVDNCPYCGKRLKKYQRITGYLRCIDNFNRGKAAEFKDRNQMTGYES